MRERERAKNCSMVGTGVVFCPLHFVVLLMYFRSFALFTGTHVGLTEFRDLQKVVLYRTNVRVVQSIDKA